ncbi:hypothetical protein CARUB_v10015629mg [Capsella rubella]|uniref:Importin N-terminal domain-containing protein n=1 Tax=Capsella rubella TaxID=81985 RepID=R0G9M2_9BRAS|nr:hypothetical protein CARUB_v10015629mg [Capsella rubella]
MEFKAHMFREMILYEWRQANVQEEDLKRILPTLVQSFLKDMAYKNSDETLLDAEVRDDDSPNVWTLRKRGEEKVYMFSYVFGHELFQILMPLAQAKLRRFDDETWKEREAIVFALGTVSKGCIRSFQPRHLAMASSFLVVLLVPLLDDLCPLIRSKSCWTLSQYGAYLLKGSQHRSYQHFERVLDGVLRKLLDVNIRVQNAACVAFTTLAKDAGEDLVLYLEVMLEHIIRAFGTAQRENIEIVYNAIRTMPNLVGGEMITKLEILIPQLVAKWEQHSDSDKDLYLMLECFTSISVPLGVRFAPFALPVFQRCMDIIGIQELAKVGLAPAGAQYDKGFIIHSLEFIYELVGGLKSGIESLVSQSYLRDMLIQCCKDESPDVRERAFALMGALARVFPVYLQPRLREFIEIASHQLIIENITSETLYVAANACWAIGHLAVKVGQEMSPFVVKFVSSLCWILGHNEGFNMALVDSSAITIGRLAWIRPDLVAPLMEHFIEPWCMNLSMLIDSNKKEDAIRGLCAAVKLNPSGVSESLYFICTAIGSFHEIKSEDVKIEVSEVLNVYKNMMGRSSWKQWLSRLDPLVKERLAIYEV